YNRDTMAEIKLSVIKWNVKNVKQILADHIELYAVVKADADGHGMVPVAKAAIEAGATRLAVAFLDEALALRKANITAPILVLGASRPETAHIAAKHKNRSEEHTSELQSRFDLVCRLLLEKKKHSRSVTA